MQPGTMGGTYGGNAVACAAAVATIQVRCSDAWWRCGVLLRDASQPMCVPILLLLLLPLVPACPQAIEGDGMLDNATQRGVQLMQGLVSLADK
jgi:4-aminobutyrate aminotransferase-like enzyme